MVEFLNDAQLKAFGKITIEPDETKLFRYWGPEKIDAGSFDGLDGIYLENGGLRLLTCLLYLNNAVGGSTAFPKLNLIIGSIGGRLLMFGNVDENNQAHELSLHQGLPPHEGEKWVMTLWFR